MLSINVINVDRPKNLLEPTGTVQSNVFAVHPGQDVVVYISFKMAVFPISCSPPT